MTPTKAEKLKWTAYIRDLCDKNLEEKKGKYYLPKHHKLLTLKLENPEKNGREEK